MRFLSLVKVAEDVGTPPQAVFDAMDKLVAEKMAAGEVETVGGLRPSSEGVRVRSDGKRVQRLDGPFTETKEVIGGYSIVNAASLEDAIRETEAFVQLHIDNWPGIVLECEVRQIEG